MPFFKKLRKIINDAMISEIIYEYEIESQPTQNSNRSHSDRDRNSVISSRRTPAIEIVKCRLCKKSIPDNTFEEHLLLCEQRRYSSSIRTNHRYPSYGTVAISSNERHKSHRRKEMKANMCPIFQMCQQFVNGFGWHPSLFDKEHNRCYCENCYPKRCPDFYEVANHTYVIPRGWCRFGLNFSSSKADVHDIWNTWANCYHGTTLEAAESILRHGDFLLPGDRLLDGEHLNIRPDHISEQKYLFTSPSIGYASLDTYAPRIRLNDQYLVKIVSQCKQKPGTFKVQAETVGATRPICPVISNDEIEWYSDTRCSCYPYGLLIQMSHF